MRLMEIECYEVVGWEFVKLQLGYARQLVARAVRQYLIQNNVNL